MTTPIYPAPQRVTTASQTAPASVLDKIDARVAPEEVLRPQGYVLTIDPAGVTLVGHDAAGVHYGRQTLAQLKTAYADAVPCLTVEDWPDLLVRGYMLDVSRDRVPKMGTIKELVDRLARLKINQLQLYTEHTLAYAGHESVWGEASPLTFEEVAEIQAYCHERFIDLVPCQNLFGHMHRWLEKPGYAELAECDDGWDTPWGFRDPRPFSLNPTDPRSFELSADLIDQLAPVSESKLFNIGCDETTDIGQGKSKALVDKIGRPAVYLDYLKKLCGRVAHHGKTPMFWGDIVLHHPELVSQIPADAVLLNWNYEAEKSFLEESKQFQEAGVRFYVCPGTSSWCTLSGRGQNAVDNLRDAAEAAVEFGAEGYLITDWGDHGHWQPFATSWVGLVYGAGVAWSLKQNRDVDRLPHAIGPIAADEPTDELGYILWDLANAYRGSWPKFMNQTWWFRHLKAPEDPFDVEPWNRLTPADVRGAIERLDAVTAQLDRYRPSNPEASRLKEEAAWCVEISRWGCRRVAKVLASIADGEGQDAVVDDPAEIAEFEALVEQFQTSWLARYRPGGLSDSVNKLTKVLRIAEFSPSGT